MMPPKTTLAKELLFIMEKYPAASCVVIVVMLLSSAGQMLAMSSLYPVLELLTGVDVQGGSVIRDAYRTALGLIGLGASVGGFLVCLVVVTVLYEGISGLCEIYQGLFVRTVENSIRGELVRSTINARWMYLRALNHGGFINLVTREAEEYKGLVKAGFLVVNAVMHSVVLISMALWIDWRMTVIGVSVMVFGSGLFIPLFRRAGRLGHQWTDAFNELSNRMLGVLRSLKVSKASSLEPYLIAHLSGPLARVGGVYYGQRVNEAVQTKLSEVIAVGAIAVVIYCGLAVLAMRPPDIVMMLVVFSRVLPHIRSTADNYNRARSKVASAEAIRRHLRETQRQKQFTGTCLLPAEWRTIECRDLTFSYMVKSPHIVEGFSLNIGRGEFWGIAGPTGSGKTTFLDLILGLSEPQRGLILIGGISLQEINLSAWHAKIGYLSQDPLIFSGTIRSNLMWGLDRVVESAILMEALRQAHLHELVENDPHGLEKPILENGNNLSGGEKQRLALARCFLRNPDLLILDEPTSALDRDSEIKIMEAITELRGKVTVLIVTHRKELLGSCDGIIRFCASGVTIEHEGIQKSNVDLVQKIAGQYKQS